jgi:hypothetical protein
MKYNAPSLPSSSTFNISPAFKSPPGRNTADPSTAVSLGVPYSLKHGLYNLHEHLIEAGFNPINSANLVACGEIIYNRGIGPDGADNGRSNFYVFVKVENDLIKVFFTNPAYDLQAFHLRAKELHHLHIATKFGGNWDAPIIQDIVSTASKKPDCAYFIDLHGHCGFIGDYDLLSHHWDDGFSEIVDIVRKHMQYNYDINAMGYHNNFVAEFFGYRLGLEKQAGIVSVPSIELTLCINKEGANGPHENLWFASIAAAHEYHKKFLSHRRGKYPPYGPWAGYEELIKYNRELIQNKELAVGIAHPAAAPIISWIGRICEGDWSLKELERHVQQEVHGIGAFNLSISPSASLKFDGRANSPDKLDVPNPSENAYFHNLVRKWNTSKEGALLVEALNMAWAFEMRERFGKFIYADHDIHNFPPIAYNYSIHGLGKMYNILDLGSYGMRNAKPSAPEIIKLLQSESASSILKAFIPYDPKNADLVKMRNYYASVGEYLSAKWDSIKTILKTAPQIWGEIKDSFAQMVHRIKSLYN